jgi:hypothetical protein
MTVNQSKKDTTMLLPMMNTQEMMTTKSLLLKPKNLKFSSSLSVTTLMKVHFQKFLESTEP